MSYFLIKKINWDFLTSCFITSSDVTWSPRFPKVLIQNLNVNVKEAMRLWTVCYSPITKSVNSLCVLCVSMEFSEAWWDWKRVLDKVKGIGSSKEVVTLEGSTYLESKCSAFYVEVGEFERCNHPVMGVNLKKTEMLNY